MEMLGEEEANDGIDHLLSENFGGTDDEYVPNHNDASDSDIDMDIVISGNKRKRSKSINSRTAKRLHSDFNSDSCESTSTVRSTSSAESASRDESTITERSPLNAGNNAERTKSSKKEIGEKISFEFFFI